MGIAVSHWRLARTVSQAGQLGVVSGTALPIILVRRLQDGDLTGDVRRALASYPDARVVKRILDRYFIEGGKAAGQSYTAIPMPTLEPNQAAMDLLVVASYVEVFLAKENHSGVVGLNLLEKVQLCTLGALYGAMLAGVDYVLMGAGIPRNIPGVLDSFAEGKRTELKIDVDDSLPGESFTAELDPAEFSGGTAPRVKRPYFLPVVSSATLALTLARRSNGRVDGFVVEGDSAGGHNAPPRGAMTLSDCGEPVYGTRDVPELTKIRDLGLPFWVAGSYAHPEKLVEMLALGATGIQVGSAFALCRESGVEPGLRAQALAEAQRANARVFTDPYASPTGFPFKSLPLPGTLSEASVYDLRRRICDLGFLRSPYRKADGSIGYRCASEPEDDYVRKGGVPADAAGRKCLCNALAATAGYAQSRENQVELPLLTLGSDLTFLPKLLKPGEDSYSATDVIRYLLGTN